MAHPNLILDGDGDVWSLDPDTMSCSDPYYDNHTHGYERLSKLIKDYGPVRALVEGEKLELPFTPVAEGRWVQFPRHILPSIANGRVHHYDDGKLYYEVIINVPRSSVKETL